MKKITLILIIFISMFTVIYAHSGRTDSNGGHWDHSTGEYHYHNGGQIEVNLNEDNEEKMHKKLQESEKETQLTDYTKVMNIIDEKDNEIEKLKDDKKLLHFIYWFIIIYLILIICNSNRKK